MRFEDYATPSTVTRRKQLRRDLRVSLGTSNDPAPNIQGVLLAANKLQGLLDLASGGRYGLAVVELGLISDYRARGLAHLPTKTISSTLSHVRRIHEEHNAAEAAGDTRFSYRLPYDMS